MRVMDIVTINAWNVDIIGIIESVKAYQDGMTVYSVRSPYTGIRYAREANEITPATEEVRASVLQDMRHMEPATPEMKIVKDYGDAIMTQGMVDAEVRATQAVTPASRVALKAGRWVIGVNADASMFA